MDKKFALMGAAGYIAPRHMRAIKNNNSELLAAVDPSDSVGIIDSYFPNADFFTEVERFDRHIDKLRSTNNKVDFFSICTPNYLHDSHIRLALRNDANAICEKPLVINSKNLTFLKKLEEETSKNIYVVLQLRHHPVILDLKNSINKNKKYNINLQYITSRGKWYQYSWKGDSKKSGGLSANIGIHFFDMLVWIFGDVISNQIIYKDLKTNEGYLRLERADVKWKLSIDPSNLPDGLYPNVRAYRSIKIDNKELEFSKNFTNLHDITYSEILNGNGFRIKDAEPSLEIINEIINHY